MSASNLPAQDQEGYLLDFHAWSVEIAQTLALGRNLHLTEAHLEVIQVLRNFYAAYGIIPPMRIFVKQLAKELGEKKGSSAYLMMLYPNSPMKLACLIGGLPKPTNCL